MKRSIWLFCALLAAEPLPENLRIRFANPPEPRPQIQEKRVSGPTGVHIYDYSFRSPVQGRVPGTLIVPASRGRHPVILYGHWMQQGSSLRNRREFFDEAILMARAGAICLLLDGPLVRPG